MYGTLLKHQWKKTLRSRYFSEGWGMKILLGFLFLYFGLSFLALGFFLPEMIEEFNPDAESVTAVFSSFILYYVLVDIAMRFFLQDLNLLSVQHYLLQNIRKKKVIHFLLGSSIYNFFNFLPLLFIVPFAFRGVMPEFGATIGITWLASMLLIMLADHFLVIYFKRAAALKLGVFIGFAAVVVALFVANSFGYISLNDASSFVFQGITQPWFMAAPALIMALAYALNFKFLKSQSYIDKWRVPAKEANTQNFGYLEGKGIVGTMMANEIKLIIRNKRTKSVAIMTLLFCFYGLLFYSDGVLEGVYEGMGWKIFAGIFMTGIFMMNYGQFLIGWEGAYFDGILTRAYPMRSFFQAKFWLLAISCVITYIITLPYAFIDINALWINTACFLYNIGFNTFLLLFASTYIKKKIDLSKGSAFNYQGTSATQFIVMLPLMVVPILIFVGFNVFDKPYYGLLTLGALGLLSLAFYKQWFNEIIANFKEKKYRNAAGFREN